MRLGPALLALALVACRGRAQPAPDASNPPRARGASTFEAPAAPLVAEGRALVGRFECARCHSIESIAPASPFQDCVGCHRRVKDGTFDARPEHLREWSANLVDLVDSPSLSYVGARLRPSWIAAFLQDPHDVRPNLRATMPRLAVSAAQARAIAAFLTRDAVAEGSAPPAEDPALVTRGRALFAERACGGCHRFDDPARIDRAGAQDASAVTPHALAPDLRFTRQRFRSENLARWILDPQRIKPGTAMPALVRDEGDARALAAYVLYAPLREPTRVEAPAMLPVLARRVSWQEVSTAVFARTCRHCHADRDFAFGDGGPGNTGGFGFAPRGLDLSSHNGALSGMLVGAERRSIFAVDDSGLPRIVRALRARQLEEAGQRDPDVRGMPLGHPALSAEQLQLVRSWIAAGRPLE
jgi:cytochrome c2